jgi:hypothetical protein
MARRTHRVDRDRLAVLRPDHRPYQVEVAVEPPVAAVVVELDGRAAGEMHGRPWKIDVDFGGRSCRTSSSSALSHRRPGGGRDRELVNMPQTGGGGADRARA